jgi:hypothetical protein
MPKPTPPKTPSAQPEKGSSLRLDPSFTEVVSRFKEPAVQQGNERRQETILPGNIRYMQDEDNVDKDSRGSLDHRASVVPNTPSKISVVQSH